MTRRTRPVLPLSAPAITTTVSPDFMCRAIVGSPLSLRESPGRRPGSARGRSDDLARERHDLHEVLVAKLAGHGAEDSGAAGVVFLVDHDGGVAVEPHVRAVGPLRRLLGADDDAADDLALLHVAGGHRFLDGA